MQKSDTFMGRFVGDLGAVLHAGMVMIGERLGMYEAPAKDGDDRRAVRQQQP